MNRTIYIDTEFTDLEQPLLLSLGLVTSDCKEHYVELDLADPASAATLAKASDFARGDAVLGQWGRVPGAAASRSEMAQRTASWLREQIQRLGQPVDIAFDCATDYRLLEGLLREAGIGDAVRLVIRPLDVAELICFFDGMLGASHGLDYAARRGLERHHALADAHALRAAVFAMHTGKRVKY